MKNGHGAEAPPPSPWLTRWWHLVATPEPRVLDLACGSGRHVRWLAAQGARVTAVDRDVAALQRIDSQGVDPKPELLQSDLEAAPWPLPGRVFEAVVVTHYLWRPLVPMVRASLAPGGVLIWETFATGQETIGRPANPDFLLRPGELLGLATGLRIVAYEDGVDGEPLRFVQRIAAVREATPGTGWPLRYALAPPAPRGTRLKSADSEDPA